ncbi:MAG: hypothetical protein MI685_13345 [Chlorobiales bacterium]|nr:hypothetical protein [Chlorobiales bacterium]
MKSLKNLFKILLIPSMLFVIGCCCEEAVMPTPEPEPVVVPPVLEPQPARG